MSRNEQHLTKRSSSNRKRSVKSTTKSRRAKQPTPKKSGIILKKQKKHLASEPISSTARLDQELPSNKNKNYLYENSSDSLLFSEHSQPSSANDITAVEEKMAEVSLKNQKMSRWTSSREIRSESLRKRTTPNYAKDQRIKTLKQLISKKEEPYNNTDFNNIRPKLNILIKRPMYNPYKEKTIPVEVNDDTNLEVILDDDENKSNDLNRNPTRIRRLSSITLSMNNDHELVKTFKGAPQTENTTEQVCTNIISTEQQLENGKVKDTAISNIPAAVPDDPAEVQNEFNIHNIQEDPEASVIYNASDSSKIQHTQIQPYKFKKDRALSENQIFSYDLKVYSCYTHIFFILFDDRKELLDALFTFTSKLRDIAHIQDVSKNTDYLLAYNIFSSVTYASNDAELPGLIDLIFTMVLFRASIQFNRKHRFFLLNKYSITIQDSLGFPDDRIFSLYEFKNNVDFNLLNKPLSEKLTERFLTVIYSIVKIRSIQHYISLNIRSNPLLLLHVVKQRTQKTKKEKKMAKLEKYRKKMEKELNKGRGKDEIALIVENGEDKTVEILVDEKIKSKKKKRRKRRKEKKRQKSASTKTAKSAINIEPEALFSKKISSISDSKITFSDLKVSFDFDYFNIFMAAGSSFLIFRSHHTPNITFNKMVDTVPKFKTSLFIETNNKCKKISDFLLLNFANSETSIGRLFFNFIIDAESDNKTKREIISEKIINVANKYVKELISSNIKYCTTKKSFTAVYMPSQTSTFERAFLEDNPYTDKKCFTSRKRQPKTSGELIIPEDKQITDFKKMSSEEFSKILVYIFNDKELKKILKGIYISGVGTKESCNTEKTPADLHAMVTQVLKVENFDLFTVDAAVQFCVKNEEKTPYSLFFNSSNLTNGSKKGICNTFGSQTTQNTHVTNVRYNSQSKKLEIPSHGLLKINFYSTLISTLFPRTLKLSRALQFSGIGLFFFICDRIGFKKPDIRFLDLLDDILAKGIKMMNSHFGYRFEATILFDTASEWQTNIYNKLERENCFLLYRTNDLIALLNDYIQILKSSVREERTEMSELSTLCIKEILIVQHIFQGQPNTHQLKNKRILDFLKQHLISRSKISAINVSYVCDILHGFLEPDAIEERAKLIISKCYQLSSNCKKIVTIYDQIIKVKTSSDLTQLFLKEYNEAFRVQTEQKKMERILKDSNDLKKITIDNFFSLLVNCRREYEKFTKRKKLSLIARMIRWLHDNKIAPFLDQLEKIFFANNTEPLIGIYDNHGISVFYSLIRRRSTDFYEELQHSHSPIGYIEETERHGEKSQQKISINGLPENVIDYLIHGIRLQKKNLSREDHTIVEKSRAVAGAHLYGHKKNAHIKIHNDIRFALFGLKTPEQIRDIIKSYRSMKKTQNASETSIKNLTSIERNAQKFKPITDFAVFEKIYSKKNISLHGTYEHAFRVMVEHLNQKNWSHNTPENIGNIDNCDEIGIDKGMNEISDENMVRIPISDKIEGNNENLIDDNLYDKEQNSSKTNIKVSYGYKPRKKKKTRNLIESSDYSDIEDVTKKVAPSVSHKSIPAQTCNNTRNQTTIQKTRNKQSRKTKSAHALYEENGLEPKKNSKRPHKEFTLKSQNLEVDGKQPQNQRPKKKRSKAANDTVLEEENVERHAKHTQGEEMKLSDNDALMKSDEEMIINIKTSENTIENSPHFFEEIISSSKLEEQPDWSNDIDDQFFNQDRSDIVEQKQEDDNNMQAIDVQIIEDKILEGSSSEVPLPTKQDKIPKENRPVHCNSAKNDLNKESQTREYTLEEHSSIQTAERATGCDPEQTPQAEHLHNENILTIQTPQAQLPIDFGCPTVENLIQREDAHSTSQAVSGSLCTKATDNIVRKDINISTLLDMANCLSDSLDESQFQQDDIPSKSVSQKTEDTEIYTTRFFVSKKKQLKPSSTRKSASSINNTQESDMKHVSPYRSSSRDPFVIDARMLPHTRRENKQSYSIPIQFINEDGIGGERKGPIESYSLPTNNLESVRFDKTDERYSIIHNSDRTRDLNVEMNNSHGRRFHGEKPFGKNQSKPNNKDQEAIPHDPARLRREKFENTPFVCTESHHGDFSLRNHTVSDKAREYETHQSIEPSANVPQEHFMPINFHIERLSLEQSDERTQIPEVPRSLRIYDESDKFNRPAKKHRPLKHTQRERRVLVPEVDLRLDSAFMNGYLRKLRNNYTPGSVICFSDYHQSMFSSHIRPNKQETDMIVTWLLENSFIVKLEGCTHYDKTRYFRLTDKIFL